MLKYQISKFSCSLTFILASATKISYWSGRDTYLFWVTKKPRFQNAFIL